MSQTFKPTINVPTRMTVKYADLVEGKYGPQLRLKGTPDGMAEDVYVYVPVDQDAELLSHGAVEKKTEKGSSYAPIAPGLWTILKAQGPGEKYAVTTLTAPNGKPPVVQPTPTAKDAPTPPPEGPDPRVKLYDACFRHVLKLVTEQNTQADPPVVFTETAVASMTATLFIGLNK